MTQRWMVGAMGWALGAVLLACGPVSREPSNPDGTGAGGGTPDAGASCTPLTVTACPGPGEACGPVPDGCGGTIDCGKCGPLESCGALTASYCGACTADGICTERLESTPLVPLTLFALAADDVWITDKSVPGRIYEWKPTGWTDRSVAVDYGGPLEIWGTSASNLWSISMNGIWHWDGTRWTLAETRWTNLRDIGGSAANDIWAVGSDGLIVHYDGTQWTEVPSATTATLWAVSVRAADDAWATGDGTGVVHWDGQAWKVIYPATNMYPNTDIASISPTEALILSSVGDVILRVTTTGDEPTVYGSGQLGKAWAVWAFSPTDVWTVGAWSSIQHYDGTTWTTLESNPYGSTYHTLSGAPNGDVWFSLDLKLRRHQAR